jgi:hypothetical protein
MGATGDAVREAASLVSSATLRVSLHSWSPNLDRVPAARTYES